MFLGFLAAGFVLASAGGCSIVYTRPVQQMSDTSAAIRAAREVQADTLAPELYRQANEWFFRAKHEYKFKNFKLAQEYADKARTFAEAAEFEALRNGGNRSDTNISDQGAPAPAPGATSTSYDYPTPTGTPADVYDQRKAAEDAANKSPNPSANNSPSAPPPGGAPGH